MQKSIDLLHRLGQKLSHYKDDSLIQAAIIKAEFENAWFTAEMIDFTLNQWAKLLNRELLTDFISRYQIKNTSTKTVGIVMAGNIPLVGMHDLIMVLLSGHNANVKLSSKDQVLPKLIKQLLNDIDKQLADKIQFQDRLTNTNDAVIATGSNNTARYFEHYFKNIPHIIRKNRNSVAILNGTETHEQLKKLADDVFLYFGLGCRNVSKIYVPENYDVTKILDAFEKYSHFLNHSKYMNNYIYQKAILLMDVQAHLDNDFLLLREHQSIASPMSTLHYEHYNNLNQLQTTLNHNKEAIQCICTDIDNYPNSVKLGESQKPSINTFADNIDSLQFLLNL